MKNATYRKVLLERISNAFDDYHRCSIKMLGQIQSYNEADMIYFRLAYDNLLHLLYLYGKEIEQ